MRPRPLKVIKPLLLFILIWQAVRLVGLEPMPTASTPLPNLAAWSKDQGIPMEGFTATENTSTLAIGTTETVLFTLSEGDEVKQWVAEVKVVPLLKEEQAAAPTDQVIYSGTGHEFHLHSPSSAFALKIAGPFSGGAPSIKPVVRNAHFLMKTDFLSFGFDRMCELAMQLRVRNQTIPVGFATSRFSQASIDWSEKWAAENHFTEADELVFAKQAFATVEFLHLAQSTPGLQEILKASVEMPSIWTAIRKMSFGLWFNYDYQKLAELDGSPQGVKNKVYSMPFTLTAFGSHVADGIWLVTAAKPPFLTGAGILGLRVNPPDRPKKHLELRVIAAHLP